jgi:hypothetical protein
MSNDELQYPLLRIFIDEMGHALTANAIRHAAESKAALAARCSNLRRRRQHVAIGLQLPTEAMAVMSIRASSFLSCVA